VALDNINDLKPQLGICWTDDENYAEAHWGDGTTEYIIKVKISDPAYINFDTTMIARMNLDLGDEEQEITLHKDSPL